MIVMPRNTEQLLESFLKEKEVRDVVDPVAKELGYKFLGTYHYDPLTSPYPNMSPINYVESPQFGFNYKNSKSERYLRIFDVPYFGLDPMYMGVSLDISKLENSEEIHIAEMVVAGYYVEGMEKPNYPNVSKKELIFPTGKFKDRETFTKLMPTSIRALVFASEDLEKALEEDYKERKKIVNERQKVLRTYIPKPRQI